MQRFLQLFGRLVEKYGADGFEKYHRLVSHIPLPIGTELTQLADFGVRGIRESFRAGDIHGADI